MPQPTVFVFAAADSSGDSYRRLERACCRLTFGEASWQDPRGDFHDAIRAMASDADALTGTSIRSSPLTRAILSSSESLRIVAKCTIGVDDVDVEAATELGVLVTHAPTESNWSGVAEGAMAMMLALLKKTRERDEHMRRAPWRSDIERWRPAELQGTYLGARQDGYAGITVGIVGLGRIGSRLADLLAPWRVRVVGYDPYADLSRFVHHNVERVDLETLLRESDVVTLHVVLTPETRKLIGPDQFALMKRSAILINTARGKVVDEDALIDALEKDRIAGAALDVFENEPLPAQSPLLGQGAKVLLSPHNVSYNHGSGLGPGIDWATASLLTALAGEVPDNVYNRDAIPRWRERFGGRAIL